MLSIDNVFADKKDAFPYWEASFENNARYEIVGIGLKAPVIENQNRDKVDYSLANILVSVIDDVDEEAPPT